MDPFGMLGSIASAWIAKEGQEDTNVANAQQAQQNRDFQERMSSTAHQREVSDLSAAGLNPILSASHGGSSTPAGSTAVMGNAAAAGVSSGLDAYRASSEVNKREQERENLRQENAIKKPIEIGADAAAKGAKTVLDAVKPASEAVSDAVKGVEDAYPAAVTSAYKAVDTIKELANDYHTSVDNIMAAPGKFASSVSSSAGSAFDRAKRAVGDKYKSIFDWDTVRDDKVRAGKFSGLRAKDESDIARIRDPEERAKAAKSYRLYLQSDKRQF